jgi:hypothetical protein
MVTSGFVFFVLDACTATCRVSRRIMSDMSAILAALCVWVDITVRFGAGYGGVWMSRTKGWREGSDLLLFDVTRVSACWWCV